MTSNLSITTLQSGLGPVGAIQRTRVLIADDHSLVAAGLSKLLSEEFELVGTVGDGRSAIDAAVKSQPDVILMDISMPLLNGIEATRQLRVACPNSKVVFVTVHADSVYLDEALAAGASGYVSKQSAAWELAAAIRKVMGGDRYVTAMMGDVDLKPRENGTSRDAHRLSTRQREVLQLVAEGRSAKEIGAILKISRKTVEFHKNLIMKKLDLHSTAELARYAVRERIVDQ